MENSGIDDLREALAASPDNLPLRRHLARTLLAAGRAAEAIEEYRRAISLSPHDVASKLGLCQAYYSAGNSSAAFVIVEELLGMPDAPASTHLLHSRLLLDSKQVDRAAKAYRRAVEDDAELADEELAKSLGVDAQTGLDEGAKETFEDDEEGRVRVSGEGTRALEAFELERPKIAFKDVGGMNAVKDEIRIKIILPQAHPELYKLYGKPVGGGILLYGPPGCGKTYLARATAGEVRAGFLAVGINDVLDMWLGNSEKNLHSLFALARKHRPCVLFFDEVDALGASRSDMRTSSTKQLINQFLSELDGVKSSNDGVLIIGATNAPWHLDSAFRRPGRFDQVLFVPPPDEPARQEILQVILRDKPQAGVDYPAVAARTEGFSGADLKGMVDRAIEAKLRDAIASGKPSPLGTKDLTSAAKGQRPTTREWFATARNYALYSNEGGIYDDVLKYLK